MLFKAPTFAHITPLKKLPTEAELSTGYCGIHRGDMEDVYEYVPHLAAILEDAPVDLSGYAIDIKVHMLMKGQYPCIPNWHCDNVPRTDDGLAYDRVNADEKPTYIWVSGAPTTEFMAHDEEFENIKNHGDLADAIEGDFIETFKIPERVWTKMDQMTPHRGTPATENCWRIFVRLTPVEIVPARPVFSVIRRHTQVYLPTSFHW